MPSVYEELEFENGGIFFKYPDLNYHSKYTIYEEDDSRHKKHEYRICGPYKCQLLSVDFCNEHLTYGKHELQDSTM